MDSGVAIRPFDLVVLEPAVDLRERETDRSVVARLSVPDRIARGLEVSISDNAMRGPSVDTREDLELVAGEEKHGLGGSIDEHLVDVVGASIVGVGAFPLAHVAVVRGDILFTQLLADVCVDREAISAAVDVVVNHRGPAPDDPHAVMLVVHVSDHAVQVPDRAHGLFFDANLGISGGCGAFSLPIQVESSRRISGVGAELRMDVPPAPVGADLVVPSEGIGPPVLDLLVYVIKAEVEVDVREVLASVDTTAHVGGTLGI